MAKGFIRERITKKGEHRWDVVVNYRDSSPGSGNDFGKPRTGAGKPIL